jgi:DNA invertase Pin-like site-specific DNA recombinase
MKAAIYARVSTQDKQFPENQLAQLRAFCQAQAWTVEAEYIDWESGKTSERTEFQRLFQDASRRRFDVVLFWALDRFSREGARQTLDYLNVLTSYGVQFRSFTEQYLDSCGIFKEAVISILAVIAKQERLRLSERTVAGLERARAQGKKLGRPHRIIDRQALQDRLDRGENCTAIAAALGISKATASRRIRELHVQSQVAEAE